MWMYGGNLYILGGTVTNNYDNSNYGRLRFNSGGGYMSGGSLTAYYELIFEPNSSWYATGGDIHLGGSVGYDVSLKNNSISFSAYNVVVDEDVTGGLSGASTVKVDVSNSFTLRPGSQFTLWPPSTGSNVVEIEVGSTFSMEANATKSASSDISRFNFARE